MNLLSRRFPFHTLTFCRCLALGRRALVVLILVFTHIFFPSSATFAQSATGFPFASISGGPFDTVNLANLNVHFNIPIVDKAGRGLPFSYSLGYNSTIFAVVSTPTSSNVQQSFIHSDQWGWNSVGTSPGLITSTQVPCVIARPFSTNPPTAQGNFTYIDSSGSGHPFPSSLVVSSDATCAPLQSTGDATDQSGYTMTITPNSFSIQDIAGNVISAGQSIPGAGSMTSAGLSITDPNGNMVSSNPQAYGQVFTDTLGETVLSTISTRFQPNATTISTTYTYSTPGGGTASVVVNYGWHGVAVTAFLCPNIGDVIDFGGVTSMGGLMVDSIVLPDGSKYTFQYEPAPETQISQLYPGSVTGRIASVTLPTGATISYSFLGPHQGIICSDGTAAGFTRTTPDGTWTYSRSVTGTASTTTVTDPQGNQTVYNFQGVYETERQIYQGSVSAGTLLKTVISCYNGNNTNCNNSPISQPITQQNVFLQFPNGQVAEKAVVVSSQTGLIQEVDEYDFGAGTPGPLKRKTVMQYAALGNHILNRLAAVTVYDSSNTQVSQTSYAYDESPVSTTSALPQHALVSGARGNPTSIKQWLNTTNTNVVTTSIFDDAGNVSSITDPGGHTTSFTYDCGGAFVSGIVLPDTASPNLAHHKVSRTHDCNTGLLLSSTDENNQSTTFSYDTMFRPTEIDFPDGGQTLFSYPSTTERTVQNKIDSSRFTFATSVADSYGRTSRTAVANGESVPYDQQDFCYDSNGKLAFRSYPYQGHGFGDSKVCSGSGDGFRYDALGRLLQATHSDGTILLYVYNGRAVNITDEGNGTSKASRILQTDALGRLNSVCEVSSVTFIGSGGAPVSCGLDVPGTGLLTSYNYDTLDRLTAVAQGAVMTRAYAYDSLSRLISESEPEWSSNSTATPSTMSYSYDNDGLLLTRVRPAPNQASTGVNVTTNYQYDPLHRVIGWTYTNDSTGTPAVTYNYDEMISFGIPLNNTLGRLSSETTGSPFVAGQIFSFNSMGRPQLNGQCTPRTCPSGVYNLHYQYDLLGNIISADNGVGVTFNYSYNIAGRITNSTSSLNDATHPGTLLSNAHYSPSGVLTDTLGNGIIENNGYSPRGLLQSSQVNPANGVSGSGVVNLTGSLQSLTQSAGPGIGSVTINGTEKHTTTNPCLAAHRSCPITTYDAGTVSVTVNGHQDAADYGQNDDVGTIANNLAGFIRKNSPFVDYSRVVVNAGPPATATINLTARTSGSATNYSFLSATTGGTSFASITSGSAFTGGVDASTTFDSGTTAINVNNHTNSYSWSGSGTNTQSITQGLCSAINSDVGAFITASTTGTPQQCSPGSSTVLLTSKQGGIDTNYTLSASSGSGQNSFAVVCPGFTSCGAASLTSGGASVYSYSLGYAPNGNIASANDLVNGNWTYSYDQLNRISAANKNAGQQTFSYAYDAYGNRWQQNAPQGGPAPQYLFDNRNHITGSGVIYDALGNITNDGFHTLTYDAENRLIKVDGGQTATYVYDPAGRRVRGVNEYLYDLAGRPITFLTLTGTWAYGEIYAAGRHLATYSGATTNFYHPDWLGTKRVMTGLNGAVSEACTGLPFIDGVNCTGTNWTFSGFTDDVHDFETNLEHTLFRQYSGTQSRFLTPDPYSGSMDVTNPQSFNRYAYVSGSPMTFGDPDGLACKFFMGINTPAGSKDALMAQNGIDSAVYTYPNGGKISGVLQVADQPLNGPNDNTANFANGFNQLSGPPDSNTVFIWSGAAQAFSSAVTWNMVSTGGEAFQSVQNFVYISPGSSLFSSLPGGDKTVKFHGKGPADFFTTLFSRLHGGHGQGVDCSHGDLSCILDALKAKRPDLFKNCNSQAQTNPISGLTGGDGILPSLNPWLGFSPWLFNCGEEGCSTAINPLFFFTFTYGTFGGGAFSF